MLLKKKKKKKSHIVLTSQQKGSHYILHIISNAYSYLNYNLQLTQLDNQL